MMKKRFMKKVLAGALIPTMIITGCGEMGGGSREERDFTNPAKTVVIFQTWNPSDTGPDSAIYKIIDAFEQIHPDIEIDYRFNDSGIHEEQLKIDLMAGQGPDVFGISPGASFEVFREYEEDITYYAEDTYGADWADEYTDFCMDMVTDGEGVCHGLPLGTTYAGFAWADVNMLKEYGLDVPTTYTDLLEASRVLRAAGKMPLAIGAKDSWLCGDTFMNIACDVDAQALYSAIEGDRAFTDPAILESLTIWQNAFRDGVFQDGAVRTSLYNDINDMFQKQGSIPMIVNGSWALNMYTLADADTQKTFQSEGADHDVFLIDWDNDGVVSPVVAGVDVILCMNSYSEHKLAAYQWMDYLTHAGQEMLVNDYLEYMPSLKYMQVNARGISEDGRENLDYVITNGRDHVAGYRMIPYSELYAKLLEVLEALAIDEMTPEEAARALEEVSEAIDR